MLTVYVALLFGIPSDLRVAALGGAGAPAGLWGLGCAVVWCLYRVERSRPDVTLRRQPVRTAVCVLLGSTLASWVAAMLRPLPPFEASQADLGLLRMLSFCGLILLAADGVTNRDRYLVLLRRFTWAAAAIAALGLLQFFTGQSLVENISIPGLAPTQDFAAVGARAGFIRPAATAMSPLEYAFALSVVFPLALSLAFFDHDRSAVRRWIPTGLLGFALLVSVSRSGLIGLAVALVALAPFWPRRIRRRMTWIGFVALVAVYLLVPGMAGTMRYLFTETEGDPSALSRTGGYEIAGQFLSHAPWFGRGFGTFLPQYRILDNQYLLLLIEVGLVGFLAFASVLVCAAVGSLVGAKRVEDVLLQQVGFGLMSALVVGMLLCAFFDIFAFPMAIGSLALAVGLAGGYLHVLVQERQFRSRTAV